MLDSISQKDPKHMLKMTVYLAELSAIMSKYDESMHYALNGIRQAQELGIGRPEPDYSSVWGRITGDYLLKIRRTIILTGLLNCCVARKNMREMMLLSYYYGAKWAFDE